MAPYEPDSFDIVLAASTEQLRAMKDRFFDLVDGPAAGQRVRVTPSPGRGSTAREHGYHWPIEVWVCLRQRSTLWPQTYYRYCWHVGRYRFALEDDDAQT